MYLYLSFWAGGGGVGRQRGSSAPPNGCSEKDPHSSSAPEPVSTHIVWRVVPGTYTPSEVQSSGPLPWLSHIPIAGSERHQRTRDRLLRVTDNMVTLSLLLFSPWVSAHGPLCFLKHHPSSHPSSHPLLSPLFPFLLLLLSPAPPTPPCLLRPGQGLSDHQKRVLLMPDWRWLYLSSKSL